MLFALDSKRFDQVMHEKILRTTLFHLLQSLKARLRRNAMRIFAEPSYGRPKGIVQQSSEGRIPARRLSGDFDVFSAQYKRPLSLGSGSFEVLYCSKGDGTLHSTPRAA